MEPISVMGALLAGATAVFKDTASAAVKDAYQALKKMVERRLSGTPSASTALVGLEAQPPVPQPELEKALIESGANKDPQIVRQARKLDKVLKGDTIIAKRSQVAIRGSYAAGRDIVFGAPPRTRAAARKRRKNAPKP